MKMLFAIQCHNFQHRLCWQLSSLLEQEKCGMDLIVDIACMKDNGTPTTRTIANHFFDEGLYVDLNVFDDTDVFAKRGLVRNKQVEMAIDQKFDWIFFADCDNVYPPNFFKLLVDELKTTKATNCIYCPSKKHTDIEATNQAVKIDQDLYIKNTFKKASAIPTIVKYNKRTAAGCMQVCRVQDIIDNAKGRYVRPRSCKDRHLFNQGQKARSDMQFRKCMGGSTMINLPQQIHLNHYRDKELGYHSEEQR